MKVRRSELWQTCGLTVAITAKGFGAAVVLFASQVHGHVFSRAAAMLDAGSSNAAMM
jgi:hypothetical protein